MAFRARFTGGQCVSCGHVVNKGEEITWNRKGEKSIRHIACSSTEPTTVEPLNPCELCGKEYGSNVYSCQRCANCCVTCGHELGTSVSGSGRSCERCEEYAATRFIANTSNVIDPKPLPIDPEPIARHADTQIINHGSTNGSAKRPNVLELLSTEIWTHIEERVKEVKNDNEELVGNFASYLEAKLLEVKEELAKATSAANVSAPVTVNVVSPSGTVTIPNAHKLVPVLTDLIARRKNVYIYEAGGGGKSHALPQVAEALGLRYAAESGDEQTPLYELKGYMNATGEYVPSIFYDFFKNGGVYCKEELDNHSPEFLTNMNLALANGHFTFPNGERVAKHPDFVFCGTGNTNGRGANPRYPGRKAFDAMFANRFFYLKWNYDETLEETIALEINSKSRKYIKWTRDAREAALHLALRLEITPRTTFLLAELSQSEHLTRDQLIDGVLAGLDDVAKDKLLASVPFPD